MNFSYDLANACPIVRDVPVYDAAGMEDGEAIMLGTTDPDSNADQGVAFVTGYTNANTELVAALGVVNETFSTAADIDNKPVEGSKFLKATVNPLAVYKAEYDQSTAITVTTGGVSTTVTATSLEDDIDAGWLYFVGASGSDAINKLRFITAAAAGSCTVDSAITTTVSDTFIKILPQNHALTFLNTASTKLKSQAAAGSGVKLRILNNWIQSSGRSFQELKYADHAGLDDLKNPRFWAEVRMLNHLYLS